jgi:hypothetical protein
VLTNLHILRDSIHRSAEIEGFFKPWVDQIIGSVRDQIGDHPVKVYTHLDLLLLIFKMHMAQNLLLVGGFGDSPHLRHRLQQAPGLRNIKITTPDQSGYV